MDKRYAYREADLSLETLEACNRQSAYLEAEGFDECSVAQAHVMRTGGWFDDPSQEATFQTRDARAHNSLIYGMAYFGEVWCFDPDEREFYRMA